MRYWKYTPSRGLTPFDHPGLPEWIIDKDAIDARKPGQTSDEDRQATLARFDVVLENGQKTFVFAREFPDQNIVEAIRHEELSRSL